MAKFKRKKSKSSVLTTSLSLSKRNRSWVNRQEKPFTQKWHEERCEDPKQAGKLLAEDLAEQSVVADGANEKFIRRVIRSLAPSDTSDTRSILYLLSNFPSTATSKLAHRQTHLGASQVGLDQNQWARLESNQHALAGTCPSSMRVCQFRCLPPLRLRQAIESTRSGLIVKSVIMTSWQNHPPAEPGANDGTI